MAHVWAAHASPDSYENVVVQRWPADAYLAVFLMNLAPNPSACQSWNVRWSNVSAGHWNVPPRSPLQPYSILHLPPRWFPFFFFSIFSTWTEKRLRFFSWENLGEVCCSVSREWEWNPVLQDLISLPTHDPIPKSSWRPASCPNTPQMLGNSRSAGFRGFGCAQHLSTTSRLLTFSSS